MKFKLDTENAGCDEILDGDSIEEVTQDVLNRYECDELPEGWSIAAIATQYNFTDDIARWVQDHAREIAEHLWAPNLGSGWKAWLYPGKNGEVLCSYNTQNTAPNDSEIGDQLILSVWTEIEDGGSTFDGDYSEVDYIADYIFQGSMETNIV